MKARDFYKTDIKVFTEVVGFPSPATYENDNIKLEIAPDDQLKAQIRALFLDLFRKLNIDFNSLTLEVVEIKRQHYHIHSIMYGGNPISLVNDSYYDHPDFILVRNELFVVVGKKVPAIQPLFFNLILYELQPLRLFVGEFISKNFTTNPSSVAGMPPYVSGLYGMNQNGDIVFVSKFSQPVKLDESYVFVQKILTPTYSPKIPPIIIPKDVYVHLLYPHIEKTTDIDIVFYIPQITVSKNFSISIYHPGITTSGNISINIYHPDIITTNPNVTLYYPDIITTNPNATLYYPDIITAGNINITGSSKPQFVGISNISISLYKPQFIGIEDITIQPSTADYIANDSQSSEFYPLNMF